MLVQLRQPVKVNVAGVTKTIEYIDAFNQSLSQDLLKASVGDKLKFLEKLDKLGLAGKLNDQAKLDSERAEVEDLRRHLVKQQHLQKLISEGERGLAGHWRLQTYITARALGEFADSCICGSHSTNLLERIDVLRQTYTQSVEADAQRDEMLEMLREDLRHPEGDDQSEEEDDDDDDYEEGGVEYDPDDYDEEGIPGTGDPNDAALDIANGELTPEDLIPPTCSVDGEDQS